MRRATLPVRLIVAPIVISIHALHEESDQIIKITERRGDISIHALHEESDTYVFFNCVSSRYFNPRSP